MSAPAILLARLERAMATMDRRAREIFLAHRLDALSYDEIAARTGLTVAEVEQHIARVIFHLDRELTAMEREGASRKSPRREPFASVPFLAFR